MEPDSLFKYHFSDSDRKPEIESVVNQVYTIDRGLNTARVASFVVEPHNDAFICLSQSYLKTRFRITKEDNSPIGEEPSVFLTPHYSSNLWSSVSISLNNTNLAPGNDYAYTALMTELLGASPAVRDAVLRPLAGWGDPTHGTSKIDDAAAENPVTFEDYKTIAAASKEVVCYHRIHSDFMQTCSQLLPNKMQLGITLSRGKDDFVLGRDASDTERYKIDVISVSLFIKRVQPNPTVLGLINSQLSGGGKLYYQRLHMIAFPCALGSLTWVWHNCFNNIVPRRVFVAVTTQDSYFGNYNRDGRDIRAEPYTCDWKYSSSGVVDWEASDAKSPFAGLSEVIGVFSSPRQNVGISYLNYRNGATIFGVSLDHAEGLSTVPGSFDIHIEMAKPAKEPLMILVLGEYPKSISFDANRQLTEL